MLDHSVGTQEVTGGSALMDILCVITSVADPNLVKSRILILSLQTDPCSVNLHFPIYNIVYNTVSAKLLFILNFECHHVQIIFSKLIINT